MTPQDLATVRDYYAEWERDALRQKFYTELLDQYEKLEKECERLRARVAELEAELSAFRSLMVSVVPGDGSGVEVPATPDSLRSYISELQSEWDEAEKRVAELEAKGVAGE